MNRGTRLAIVIGAVVVAVAALVILSPGGDDSPDQTATTQADRTTTATTGERDSSPGIGGEADDSDGRPSGRRGSTEPVLVGGRVTTLKFHKGDRIRFAARSKTDEEVHVHGYDIPKDVQAGGTVSFDFPANIEGIFEIEFEHSGEQIGKLVVEP